MKQRIFTLLFALLGMVTSAWADLVMGGINYRLNSTNHTASVIKITSTQYKQYAGDVVIPQSITHYNEKYDVTSIDREAFQFCSNLTFIHIPNSVTRIGYSAFEGCSSLTSVNIPNSVTRIGYSAFEGCSSLTSVNIPNSVTSIGYSAFEGCSSLTSVNIPNSVTSIGYSAFEGCSSLTSVNIPDGVTSIGYRAFYGCSSLTSVNIPNSVTSIGSDAFSYCIQLTTINVSDDNTTYQSIDGILYNKDLTTLLCYPAAKSGDETFFVPTSVTEIGSDAFAYCKNLTSIIIPSSVSKVGDGVFREGSLKNYCFLGMLDYYEFLCCIPENSII